MDGSPELCARAAALLGQEVLCARFEDYRPVGTFDGVWACASLLHLAPEAIPAVMRRLAGALAEGVFDASFKYGALRGMRGGRYFTDMDEAGLERLMAQLPGLSVAWTRVTADVRPGRESERWLNVLCRKPAGDRQSSPDPAP